MDGNYKGMCPHMISRHTVWITKYFMSFALLVFVPRIIPGDLSIQFFDMGCKAA